MHAVAERIHGVHPTDTLLRNALQESFLLHARNLIEFLDPCSTACPYDVLASDYVREYECPPELVATCYDVRQAATKRLTRLTYMGLDSRDESKSSHARIAEDIGHALDAFIVQVDDAKLGPLMRAYKAGAVQRLGE